KFPCRREDADRAVAALKLEFSDQRGEGVSPSHQGRDALATSIDTQDGIRIDWPDARAWLHARPSNTEPIMRIIAEAPDRATAEKKIAEVQDVVRRTLPQAV